MERGWAYRRMQPEGTVLYEAVKDNLATLLAAASEVERGLPRYVERLLEKRGALPAQGPENALQAWQTHSLQQRLRWTEVDVRPPPREQPRCALLEGFSLHANTHLAHAPTPPMQSSDPSDAGERPLRCQAAPRVAKLWKQVSRRSRPTTIDCRPGGRRRARRPTASS